MSFEESYVGRLRAIVGNRLLMTPGSRATIVDNNDRVLLQMRGDNRKWGLPGGAAEENETIGDSAIREVEEETGLRILNPKPFGYFSMPDGNSIVYPNGDEVQPYVVDFHATEWEGELRADGIESLDLQWFPIDDTPNDMLPRHQLALAAFKKYRAGDGFQYMSGIAPGTSPNVPLGQPFSESHLGRLRQLVGSRLLVMPSARILVVRDGTHGLLQLRSDLNRWGLPAGFPEEGEPLDRTAVREAEEETGLKLLDATPFAVSSTPAIETVVYPNGDKIQAHTLNFFATRWEGEVTADEESLALEWIPLNAVPADMLPGHKRTVEAYLRYCDSGEFQQF